MSAEDKKAAKELMENYLKLDKGDRKYIKGWVDAKADTNKEATDGKTDSKHA